jgi:hypothetical protein
MKYSVLKGISVFALLFGLGCSGFGDETFGDFQYQRGASGTLTITKYTGRAAQVAIPDRINGAAVTAIGDYAFFGCSSLKSVSLSLNTKLGENVFPEGAQISYYESSPSQGGNRGNDVFN